jgi:hypothetical protein
MEIIASIFFFCRFKVKKHVIDMRLKEDIGLARENGVGKAHGGGWSRFVHRAKGKTVWLALGYRFS